MKLIFERSVPGRRCSILPACDVEETPLPESLRRAEALRSAGAERAATCAATIRSWTTTSTA